MRLFLASAACALFALPSAALACKCVSGTPQEVYKKTQLVVEGKVVEVTTPEREPNTVRYTFEVAKAWRGADVKDRVTVVTDKQGACAVKMAKGQSFILAATDEGMGWASVKPCHPFFKPSSARDAAATRKTLDQFKKPKPTATAEVNPDMTDEEAAAAAAKMMKKKKGKR